MRKNTPGKKSTHHRGPLSPGPGCWMEYVPLRTQAEAGEFYLKCILTSLLSLVSKVSSHPQIMQYTPSLNMSKYGKDALSLCQVNSFYSVSPHGLKKSALGAMQSCGEPCAKQLRVGVPTSWQITFSPEKTMAFKITYFQKVKC